MQNNKIAETFIKNRLKYSANRCYVAKISAADINFLWHCMTENEFNGCGHEFKCGNINSEILRAALVREMSLNPLRFECVNLDDNPQYDPLVSDIVNRVKYILKRFSQLWPNGIQDSIVICDKSDDEYHFLLDLRDCFKKIAQQNLADFNRVAYRNEIIVRFADSTDIYMPDNMRSILQACAARTATARATRRAKADAAAARKDKLAEIDQRMKDILIQMELHVRHDTKYYNELRAEYDRLAILLSAMAQEHARAARAKRTKKRSVAPKTMSVRTPYTPKAPAAQQAATIHLMPGADSALTSDDYMEESDSAEREMELLRSLTPEHMADEVFQDYVQNMVGLNLHKYSQNQR